MTKRQINRKLDLVAKKLGEAQMLAEELTQEMGEDFEDRSYNWQGSDRGVEWLDKVDSIGNVIDDIESARSELEEMKT